MASRCFRTVFLLVLLIISGALYGFPLETEDVMITVEINGNRVAVADSTDPAAFEMYKYVTTNPDYQNLLSSYKEAQKLGYPGEPVKKNIITIRTTGYYGTCDPAQFTLVRTNPDGSTASEETFRDWPRTNISKSILPNKGISGYAKEILFHETGHGVLYEAYGGNWPRSGYILHHNRGTVSDKGFAFNEGWAEAVEDHFTGQNRFMTRLGNIQYRTGKDENEKAKTEGVIADYLFAMMRSDKIEDSFNKMLKVLAAKKPNDIFEFTEGFIEMYPGDAEHITAIIEKPFLGTGDLKKKLKAIVEKAVKPVKTAFELAKSAWDKIREFFASLFGKNKSSEDQVQSDVSRTPDVVTSSDSDIDDTSVEVDISGSNPFGE